MTKLLFATFQWHVDICGEYNRVGYFWSRAIFLNFVCCELLQNVSSKYFSQASLKIYQWKKKIYYCFSLKQAYRIFSQNSFLEHLKCVANIISGVSNSEWLAGCMRLKERSPRLHWKKWMKLPSNFQLKTENSWKIGKLSIYFLFKLHNF